MMMRDFLENKFLIVPFIVWCCIQLFKFITDFVINRKPNFRRLFGAGGMPSSHSAVVATLTTLIGKEYGLGSGIFAVSFIFSLIVMYDAAGVRRAAGKQATILNKLVENYPNSNVIVTEKLVEVLGHTPFQVLVGAVIGILVGALYGIF
jgi:acid phosphatase family membrane protein YuiD